MSVDLTGGLSEERDYVLPHQPDDPDMRESVNAWIWDDAGEVGMPRIAIEAIADQWETHDLHVNLAYADGRVFHIFEPGKVHDPFGSDEIPRILGAGPLSFELVEPFRHWRMRLDGLAVETSVQDQIGRADKTPYPNRGTGEPNTPIELHLDIKSAAPPWEQGTLLAEAARVLREQEEGDLMGGLRFEQLSRVTGHLKVGDRHQQIRGGALRVHRQGVRRMGVLWGHVWQSALFPSGRGFGLQIYPARDDGRPTLNEGFLFEGEGQLTPALVVEAPWLHSLEPNGEDVSVVLETDKGTTTIEGESIISTFGGVIEGLRSPLLQSAIVRYTWDGESANGMMERSTRQDQVRRP
jgi:hypothetical protein